MLETGTALKVTTYLNRDTGAAHGFLSDEIVALLRCGGIEGATMLQTYAGFGSHRKLHTDGAGDVAGLHLPVIIYFIESPEKVNPIPSTLLAIVTDGLVEAHPTTILKSVTSPEKVIS